MRINPSKQQCGEVAYARMFRVFWSLCQDAMSPGANWGVFDATVCVAAENAGENLRMHTYD